jgi:hypothetical protein
MNAPATTIDFAKIEGPVYTGRLRGELLRDALELDRLDAAPQTVEVRIPETTYTISSSFFLGLFGPSVVKAGSPEAFYRHYHFQSPSFLKEVMDSYVRRALQTRNLFA